MKLVDKITRSYVRISVLVLVIGSVMVFGFIRYSIRTEVDEGLEKDLSRIILQVETNGSLTNFPPVLLTQKLSRPQKPFLLFSDTLIFDPVEQEPEPFRQLSAVQNISGTFYAIRICTPRIENHDFFWATGLPIVLIMSLLLLGLFWLNKTVMRKSWQPFHHTLAELKQFSLEQARPLNLKKSDIDEFEVLNQTVTNLTEKVRADYKNLKEFTENASHEIQTPLAIILAKADWLLQSESLQQNDAEALGVIYEAANRLSKLNESLILLSRIENRQFHATEVVDIGSIIQGQVALLDELISAKNYKVDLQLSQEVWGTISVVLAEIMIKNLLENALRHSPDGSTILVKSDNRTVSFSNPGKHALKNPMALFHRFKKGPNNTKSPGLGLAIVYKIASVSNIEITYSFNMGQHRFILSFPE